MLTWIHTALSTQRAQERDRERKRRERERWRERQRKESEDGRGQKPERRNMFTNRKTNTCNRIEKEHE